MYVFESSSRQKNLYERMQLIRARDLLAGGSAYHCDHRGVTRRSGLALQSFWTCMWGRLDLQQAIGSADGRDDGAKCPGTLSHWLKAR